MIAKSKVKVKSEHSFIRDLNTLQLPDAQKLYLILECLREQAVWSEVQQ